MILSSFEVLDHLFTESTIIKILWEIDSFAKSISFRYLNFQGKLRSETLSIDFLILDLVGKGSYLVTFSRKFLSKN